MLLRLSQPGGGVGRDMQKPEEEQKYMQNFAETSEEKTTRKTLI